MVTAVHCPFVTCKFNPESKNKPLTSDSGICAYGGEIELRCPPDIGDSDENCQTYLDELMYCSNYVKGDKWQHVQSIFMQL